MTSNEKFTRRLVSFCDRLRKNGVDVSTSDVETASRVLAVIDPLDRTQFYSGLKAALVDSPLEEETFDMVFESFWDASPDDVTEHGPSIDEREEIDVESTASDEPEELDEPSSRSPETDEPARESTNSDVGADLTEQFEGSPVGGRGDEKTEDDAFEVGVQERANVLSMSLHDDPMASEELVLLVKELGQLLGTLRGFETRHYPMGDIDLRRALQSARIRNWKDLPRVRNTRTSTKIRFLVDVSHSMLRNFDQEFLFCFLFECVRQYDDVRTFFFDTSTVEVTTYFRSANLSRVIDQMHSAQLEWGAGTTIGACLREVMADNPFLVDHDTVVVIISDGWDAGDLEVLRDTVYKLEQQCSLLLWLNPLAASDRYEPKISSMQTVLPFVDHFAGFASLEDLRLLTNELRRSNRRGS